MFVRDRVLAVVVLGIPVSSCTSMEPGDGRADPGRTQGSPGGVAARESGSDELFHGSSGELGAAEGHHGAPRPGEGDLQAQIDELRRTVEHLENTVGHLKSELEAASSENELSTMTIDSFRWSEGSVFSSDSGPTLLCHPVEWRGYGKMLRFTRLADPVFYFEADGRPTVEGRMAAGGICGSDGSTRFTVLQVPGELEPGVSYHLRPRNENDRYRWSLSEAITVVVKQP